jgi:hypothetical protein
MKTHFNFITLRHLNDISVADCVFPMRWILFFGVMSECHPTHIAWCINHQVNRLQQSCWGPVRCSYLKIKIMPRSIFGKSVTMV